MGTAGAITANLEAVTATPRFGVVLMPTDPWDQSVATARRLEALGYHHLWVYDHLTWQRYRDRPWHAIYPWLTGIAAATNRIRIGTLVANPNIRHPAILAKDAMTIDHISGGRLTIGIGAGGVGFDASVLGQHEITPARRIERLTEFATVLDGLLSGDLTNHDGPWYTINEARMLPGCLQQPRVPIAMAGRGPRGIRLAARLGDAWITNGAADAETPDEHRAMIAQQVELYNRACVDAGRDPAVMRRFVVIAEGDGAALWTIDNLSDSVEFYQGLGFTDFVFHHPRSDDPVFNYPAEIVEAVAERYLG